MTATPPRTSWMCQWLIGRLLMATILQNINNKKSRNSLNQTLKLTVMVDNKHVHGDDCKKEAPMVNYAHFKWR